LLDEQEMPETCVDWRRDSTGIIKPDGAERSFGSTIVVDENSKSNF
jgi:hypothetical protein